MNYANKDQKAYIKEVIHRIFTIPNNEDATSVKELIAGLNQLLRMKAVVLPTVEIMTIIKHQKQQLYHATKRRITSSSNLNLLFQLDANPEMAKERLRQFMEED
ncbi:hypothetical protein [Brevibacillus fulvus]|uniref:Uncharacterized protein n=1 Tax=Brevibacillus fulvus TaxID=1125967 RepID=A0A938XYH8_9BACL|nr:hypothetical protein [Brevibacillus fulvus]MBM7589244.1 hypothetical protein [Brevibacillus fulvus]